METYVTLLVCLISVHVNLTVLTVDVNLTMTPSNIKNDLAI